ncbi:proline dehydrogenase family protein [Cohnella hongkongensis]|uniref:Proline dehydrogenase family protein n=1 Tax=Cohnella hongkongensis TaxID=178337 RepID=A0ABV9FBQ6_9BACL
MKPGRGEPNVGTGRRDVVFEAVRLMYGGCGVSLAYEGSEANDARQCAAVKNELRRLIDLMGSAGRSSTISLRLSRIGMDVDEGLARSHLEELIREAAVYGMSIMIHAEEPHRSDRALAVYKSVAERYPTAGFTLQANLQRAERDMADLLPFSGRIRIVEGKLPLAVKDGRADSAEAYLRLAERAIASGRPVSIATHDESLLREVGRRGLLAAANAEVEMLHGVRPDFQQTVRSVGRLRVYLSYYGRLMV